MRDGKIWWRTPVSAAFPPGFGTDNGWIWRLYGTQVGDYVLVAVQQGRVKGFVGFKLPPPPNAPTPEVATAPR